MDPISDGCRLCLNLLAECFTTIDNPQLKDQMEKVFCFPVEPKQGYYSGVCQSCSYAISDFYQYSEKVRQNQEILNGNVANCDPTVDSKITLENIKIETFRDSGHPETRKDACELKDEISGEEGTASNSKITLENIKIETLSDSGLPETTEGACEQKDGISGEEEVPNSGDDESNESLPKKSRTKRKGWPGNGKLDNLEAGEPTKNSRKSTTQQERNVEDQLFNKHFRMICDLCETSAATYTELLSHFREEHNGRKGYVVCCNKKLLKRDQIRDHIDFHANPALFQCAVCGYNYKDKFCLNKHMTNQHSGKDRTIVCDNCDKEFLTKAAFNLHMNEHMGIKVKRVQCGICQRWMKNEKNLRVHIDMMHTGVDRTMQCDICLQKYPHAQSLYIHKLFTHGEPKHECEFCGKKFKRLISLKEHRTAHTGEVLYACEYCGISPSRKTTLYKHLRRQHPTEWAQKKLMANQNGGPSGNMVFKSCSDKKTIKVTTSTSSSNKSRMT